MEGVVITQIRFPAGLYQRLKDQAHENRESLNRTVVEMATKGLEAVGNKAA